MATTELMQTRTRVEQFQLIALSIQQELRKVIVGQERLVHDMLVTLFGGGNALMEGVPGLGKTMLIRTLAQVLDCSFNRIQFTPDLMPSDITGTVIITEGPDGHRGFRFERGPVFANLLLADEINRAAPRTQSALLEAMQEQMVTVAGETYPLPKPFFVLATQNPIELEGTYPLPEAQLDRFLFKLQVGFPERAALLQMLEVSLDAEPSDTLAAVAGPEDVRRITALARQVLLAQRVKDAAVDLVLATQPAPDATDARRHLRYGASPRALQALVRAARVRALMQGRAHVDVDDLAAVALPVLRHRVLLRMDSELDGEDLGRTLAALVAAWRERL